jgi:hypothetical protein
MDARVLRIESSVAKAIRHQLDFPENDAMSEVGDGLARLLGWNWEARGLIPARTFDGLGRSVIKALSPDELSVVGLMITLATQEVEWFSAEIRLAAGQAEIDSYVLRHGVRGVAPAPYEAMDRLWSRGGIESALAWNWAHEFERADAVRS